MAKDFKVGDVVRPKIGGPKMTVREVRDGTAIVLWFTKNDELKEHVFKLVDLVGDASPPKPTMAQKY